MRVVARSDDNRLQLVKDFKNGVYHIRCLSGVGYYWNNERRSWDVAVGQEPSIEAYQICEDDDPKLVFTWVETFCSSPYKSA